MEARLKWWIGIAFLIFLILLSYNDTPDLTVIILNVKGKEHIPENYKYYTTHSLQVMIIEVDELTDFSTEQLLQLVKYIQPPSVWYLFTDETDTWKPEFDKLKKEQPYHRDSDSPLPFLIGREWRKHS
jgi:hypothetical protein